ncbi:hypothetical protein I4U23_009930 [Adineta vaga]|nr:hypothetical protein I4U23_009930 [Adineta vaga]
MDNPELMNDVVTNLASIVPTTNDSQLSLFDYLFDSTENNFNHSTNHNPASQHLATILQQLFSKMSDNQSAFHMSLSSSLSSSSTNLSPAILSRGSSSIPVSSNDVDTSHVLSILSLWFVLIVNPIVILFGVIGNLLATYILINGNIAKLPVSFYTIMLNISDTLNLLIPVFIFWLDNCFNRTPERGYFRDKSNFLCKALMCPDQLFAALSAWYMCAISFNRWRSVCHPSSYFFRTQPSNPSKVSTGINLTNSSSRKSHSLCGSSFLSMLTEHISWKSSQKYRQHLQAFRCIGIITLVGILCCLYPIFMHELRPVISTNQHVFDLTQKITHTYAIVWKRCYYSQKHEHAYDIIGIILSGFLHILPLTSVAAMNIMIIVRLKKRQRLMTSTSNSIHSTLSNTKSKTSLKDFKKRITYKLHSSSHKEIRSIHVIKSSSERSLTARKDQEILTDTSFQTIKLKHNKVNLKSGNTTPNRHQARDRNITIMLVSVALSYLILTLPYRLFWSYNVYIKRMHPEKLKSSVYLLKMHYIDHVLRTIRNIHYGTNFIFFIFLSKPFRRKFKQLFTEKFLRRTRPITDRNENTCTVNNNMKNICPEEYSLKLDDINENTCLKKGYQTKASYYKTPNPIDDVRMQEDELQSIVELEPDDLK